MTEPLSTDKRVDGHVIEDGIPLPSRRRAHGMTALVRCLEVGQSVLVPKYKSTAQAAALRMACRLLEGRTFTMRTVEGGVRLWRVS